MQIKYQNILLRDMQESDIADDIRWNTVETEWALWDAPWEMEEDLKTFDPEAYRTRQRERLAQPKPAHPLCFEIDADGVHIGSVSAYCIDADGVLQAAPMEEADRRTARWALGIDICDPAYWSGGWGTKALTAYIQYHLDAGYTNLYTQTWSGNLRMTGLAQKVGFRECRRKEGIRQVRGGVYDGLTFRLDTAAFAAHYNRAKLELYIPAVEDIWFTRQMQEDAATMSYNAGWDVSFGGYHPDTGCIDFPPSAWAEKHAYLTGHEPERFYAYIRERETGEFIGEVNYHWSPPDGWYELGIVVYAPCRGRGYGLPALELLLHRAFVVNGIPKLHNSFEETRAPGLAIHRKAGFRLAGSSEMVRFGIPVKLLDLELTREDYLAAHPEIS